MSIRGDQPDAQKERHDRLLKEQYDDPYRNKLKLKQPAICRQCRASYQKGRWTLDSLPEPETAQQVTCPACQRIQDKVPAAYLTISGSFFVDHEDEINSLVNHRAEQEFSQHPLNRIMSVEDKNSSHVYTFTDAHLARDIGQALQHAYGGEVDLNYNNESSILRVDWQRNN